MASWITSKLKVAETFLEQIDQQAAESLAKKERGQDPVEHALKINDNSFHSSLNGERNFVEGSESGGGGVTRVENNSIIIRNPLAIQSLGLKKSVPHGARQDLAPPNTANKMSQVQKVLPPAGNEDWTELLSSSASDSAGSREFAAKLPTLEKIDAAKLSFTASKTALVSGNPSASSKKIPSRSGISSFSKPVVSNVSTNNSRLEIKSENVLKPPEDDLKSNSVEPDAQEGSFNIIKRLSEFDFDVGVGSSDRHNEFSESHEKIRKIKQETAEGQYATQKVDDPMTYASGIFLSDLNKDASSGHQTITNLENSSALEDDIEGSQRMSTADDIKNYVQNGVEEKLHERYAMDSTMDKAIDLHTDITLYRRHGSEEPKETGTKGIFDKNSRDAGEDNQYNGHILKSQINEKGRHVADSSLLENDETDSDSTSSSNPEEDIYRLEQLQRKRKEEEMAAVAASIEVAKALIKDREELVNRLEMEKKRLDQMLILYEEQQAREAIKLETDVKEALNAMDLEKQKHYSTRMEALERISKLEEENGELAKSLAKVQRNLDSEVAYVMEIRNQISVKEVAKADIERKLTQLQKKVICSEQDEVTQAFQDDEYIVQEENLQMDQSIGMLQIKVKEMEEMIDRRTEAWGGQTDIEIELERRLSQLTDYLLQKQAQVETVSAEKAILALRMEALAAEETNDEKLKKQCNGLKRGGSASLALLEPFYCDEDLENGLAAAASSSWLVSSSGRIKKISKEIRGERRRDIGIHILLFVFGQLDTVFSTGARYLLPRHNNSLKWVALFYFFILHAWVVFILSSSHQQENLQSAAVLSLDH